MGFIFSFSWGFFSHLPPSMKTFSSHVAAGSVRRPLAPESPSCSQQPLPSNETLIYGGVLTK